jgi:hypothetical protein
MLMSILEYNAHSWLELAKTVDEQAAVLALVSKVLGKIVTHQATIVLDLLQAFQIQHNCFDGFACHCKDACTLPLRDVMLIQSSSKLYRDRLQSVMIQI